MGYDFNKADKIAEILSRLQQEISFQGQDSSELRIRSGIDSDGVDSMFVRFSTGSSSLEMVLKYQDYRSAPMTLLVEGRYEPEIEQLIVAAASNEASPLLVDVGANQGFHSINFVLALGEESRSVALEPNPDVCSILEKNLSLNGIQNRVTVLQKGLDQEAGKATLMVPMRTGSGGGSLRNQHQEEELLGEFSVDLVTLDSLNLAPSVIKIDVEGNELNVLLGSLETIRTAKPVIVIELLRKWMRTFDTHPQQVVDLLSSYGYECFAIGSELRRITFIDEDTEETNFIFHPSN